MLTAERYITLLNHYAGPVTGEQEEYEVALEDLTALFHCTERNVKLIVRKLQEEELIGWIPGRGRGNRSRIQFLVKREFFLLEFAKRLAQKGEYRYAFEFLHQYEEDKLILEQFIKWLNNQFGMEKLSDDIQARDVFRLPVYKAPLSLDPAELYYGFDSHLVRQMFDRLVQYDSEQEAVVPLIAHHWESNESGTEWTFFLRKGVRFHHGKILTAEDVVFTLERLRTEKMNAWLLSTMEQAEALDARTVKISLRQPNWLFPRLMCSSCASILPSDLGGQNESSYWMLPSGTGPFRMAVWNSNRLELTVNDDYFLGRPYLDGVKLIFLPDNIPNISKLKWEQLIANDSRIPAKAGEDWQRIETLSKGCSLMTWNRNKKGPQQSLSFRQAVNLIIDRIGMIQHSSKSGYPARSFVPQEETELGMFWYDLDAAKQLLEQSGYDGSPFLLVTRDTDADEAEWIQKQCAKIGITMHLRYEERSALTRVETVQEADAMLTCLVFADDEVCELESYLQANSSIYQHLDPGLRKWIFQLTDQILATKSKEKRRALLRQIEYRLRDEAQVLFLIHQKLSTYVHPSVRGLVINNLGWMDFKDIWLTSTNERQLESPVRKMKKSV
ncbi:MarR-like DNA-binding transcriptional regulator SgrR of sgrS sRNA [Fontibacillus phaseoli]|uniref:MarR-like DNA-binding transcriptional regulator SgrR of sgrS sRNA n=1 Tax=Fontibacillus phaseoli TaxID=1416533 RepID=A0A369B642_9BACL|nr:SgrR family transcriptional regulator [Fontibacillus phaseoli]RCX16980.1 MarR-like DNA-binding transcriptional regulator SgrR of sgrS sRNA [Fontibacillus phaseoli]